MKKEWNSTRPTVTEEERNGLKEIMEAQKKSREAAKQRKAEESASLKEIRIAQLKRQGRL